MTKTVCYFWTCQITYNRRGQLCTWYQKPLDMGTILNNRSCAPLQHTYTGKSIIQGPIHRLFKVTSNWEAFHEALTKNDEIWERHQYSKHWVRNFVKDTINQLRMKEQRKENRYNSVAAVKQQKNTEKKQFVLQYRGNISKELVKKLNKIHPVQTILTTRKLKSCLISLSLALIRISHPTWLMNSLVMNANRSMLRRLGDILPQGLQSMPRWTHQWEYMQSSATVIKQLSSEIYWTNAILNQSKLMTIETLYIGTLKPAINTHDEYRTRELTLKA